MDLEQTFLLGEAFQHNALRVQLCIESDGFALIRGTQHVQGPIPIKPVQGVKPLDIVGSTLGPFLVSPRFRHVLLESQLTGWRSIRTTVLDQPVHPCPGHELLVITGQCGPIDDTRADRAILPARPGGQTMPGWRGLVFDPDTWDGSDLFGPARTGFIFATARAAAALSSAKLANLRLEPLTEIERLSL